MKNTIWLNQGVNVVTQNVKWLNYLRTLLVAALLGCSINWTAQNTQPQEQTSTQTEVVKNPEFSVHGMVSLWSNWISWDGADLCSTNPTFIGMLDVSHNKSWLGFTTVRLDDANNDSSQPASRVTILNPHLTKKIWKDLKVDLGWKYTMFDKNQQANWLSTYEKIAYTQNGWTSELMHNHKFKKWDKDSDAIRLSVSKNLGKTLNVTGQFWYETQHADHFYARLMADTNLWKIFKWTKVQTSITFKDWKTTPTVSIIRSL